MGNYDPINRSFNAGELTEMVAERSDLDKYHSGCSVLENFIVTPYGPVQKMPGTERVAAVKSEDARLIPFQYNTDQVYDIEAGPGYARFHKSGAPILLHGDIAAWAAGTAYEIGFIVIRTSIIYVCLKDHTSVTDFLDDGDKWHAQTASVTVTGLTVRAGISDTTRVNLFRVDSTYPPANWWFRDFLVGDYIFVTFAATYTDGFYRIVSKGGSGNEWVDIDLAWSENTTGTAARIPYEIYLPYGSLDGLQWVQSNDVIYMVHPKYPQGKLMRYDELEWTYQELEINDGPFRKHEATGSIYNVHVCPSAASSGKIRLVKSGAFGAYAVGSKIGVKYSNPSILSGERQIGAKGTNYVDLTTDFVYPSISLPTVIVADAADSATIVDSVNRLTLTKTSAFGGLSVGDKVTLSFPKWRVASTELEDNFYVTASEASAYRSSIDTNAFATALRGTAQIDPSDFFVVGDFVRVKMPNGTTGAYRVMSVKSASYRITIDIPWDPANSTTNKTFIQKPYQNGVYEVLAKPDSNTITVDLDYLCVTHIEAGSSENVDVQYQTTDDDLNWVGSGAVTQSSVGEDKLKVQLTRNHQFLIAGTWVYANFAATYTDGWFKILSADTTHMTITLDFAHSENTTADIYLYRTVAKVDAPVNLCVSRKSNQTLLKTSATFFDTTKDYTGQLFELTHYRPDAAGRQSKTLDSSHLKMDFDLFVVDGWNLTTSGTWTGYLSVRRKVNQYDAWETVYHVYHESSASNLIVDRDEDEPAYFQVEYACTTGYPTLALTSKSNKMTGVVRVVSVLNATSAEVTEIKDIYTADEWTKDWKEGSFCPIYGYPRTVTFHDDRLCFGGTEKEPNTVWRSRAGDYENFKAGNNDDDAQIIPINTVTQDQIQWIVGKGALFVGTTGGEHTMRGSNDSPMTMENIKIDMPSAYGSRDIQPVLAGDTLLFVQRQGQKIREIVYSLESDGYVANDLTVLSPQVVESGIVRMAYMVTPFPVLWCITADGNLAGMTRNREQNVAAWHRHTTDGTYLDLCVTSGKDSDNLTALVERDGTVYVERFTSFTISDDIEDQYFVHGGKRCDMTLSTQATGIQQISVDATGGLATVLWNCSEWPVNVNGERIEEGCHIRMRGLSTQLAEFDYDQSGNFFSVGSIVEVTGDYIMFNLYQWNTDSLYEPADTEDGTWYGNAMAGHSIEWVRLASAVDTGIGWVNLAEGELYDIGPNIPFVKLAAGLPYTAKVAPMPFNLDYSGGTIRGKQKRVMALGASFFRSGVCKVGYSLDKLEELKIVPNELFTGMVTKEIGGTFTKDPRFYVVSDEPRQCVVRAIVPQFEIGEG